MNTIDTITAISTGLGGGIAIIRISGKTALEIGNNIWKGKEKLSLNNKRQMLLGNIIEKDHIGEKVLAVYMPNPNSYTGDDVIEIHCHGGNLSAKTVINLATLFGARIAEPGEFTYRAFINGKMDLTQAEAVSDIISANNDIALHLAENQIAGTLSKKVNNISEIITDVLAESESRMDFTEENLDWKSPEILSDSINNVIQIIEKLLESKNEGIILRNGVRVVIAGKPNVGKSSFLNLLLGNERAIVTNIPGTTRDTLEEFVNIRNIPVKLIDTAGIRDVDNIIEEIGIKRSKKSIKQAQIIIWLLDASSDSLDDEISEMNNHIKDNVNTIALWNKSDIQKSKQLPETNVATEKISILENTGIDNFLDLFEEMVWTKPISDELDVIVNSRHSKLLDDALNLLPNTTVNLYNEEWELVAVNLRSALFAINSIIGKNVSPDILDDIFSRFCIGK